MILFVIIAFFDIIKSSSTVYFTYINIPAFGWWGDSLAKSLGVPGYLDHSYTHVALAFWTCSYGPTDIAQTWTNI